MTRLVLRFLAWTLALVASCAALTAIVVYLVIRGVDGDMPASRWFLMTVLSWGAFVSAMACRSMWLYAKDDMDDAQVLEDARREQAKRERYKHGR